MTRLTSGMLVSEHDTPMDIDRLSLVAETDADRKWILDVFFTDADNSLRQMGYALQSGDRKLFVEMAHSLRGSSENMGMKRLSSLCSRAMNVVQIQSKENKELISSMSAELQRIRQYLVKMKILPGNV